MENDSIFESIVNGTNKNVVSSIPTQVQVSSSKSYENSTKIGSKSHGLCKDVNIQS